VLDFNEPTGLTERSRLKEARRPALAAGLVAGLAAGAFLVASKRRSRSSAD
jgi:hypothetical protein